MKEFVSATYQQLERAKTKAWPIARDTSKSLEERVDALLVIMEAHHYRNRFAPSFSEYARHWLWANRERERLAEPLAFLAKRYPPPEKPRIQRGCSVWGSFDDPSYGLDNR
jgi:hypothetical protein